MDRYFTMRDREDQRNRRFFAKNGLVRTQVVRHRASRLAPDPSPPAGRRPREDRSGCRHGSSGGVGRRQRGSSGQRRLPTVSSRMMWTVHGERSLYESKWVRLVLTDVEIPGGERFEHHVVRMPYQAAGTVVRDPERGVLLLWRSSLHHRYLGLGDPGGRHRTGGDAGAGRSPGGARGDGLGDRAVAPARAVPAHQRLVGSGLQPVRRRWRDAGPGEPADVRPKPERIEWVAVDELRRIARDGQMIDGLSLTAVCYALPPSTLESGRARRSAQVGGQASRRCARRSSVIVEMYASSSTACVCTDRTMPAIRSTWSSRRSAYTGSDNTLRETTSVTGRRPCSRCAYERWRCTGGSKYLRVSTPSASSASASPSRSMPNWSASILIVRSLNVLVSRAEIAWNWIPGTSARWPR